MACRNCTELQQKLWGLEAEVVAERERSYRINEKITQENAQMRRTIVTLQDECQQNMIFHPGDIAEMRAEHKTEMARMQASHHDELRKLREEIDRLAGKQNPKADPEADLRVSLLEID